MGFVYGVSRVMFYIIRRESGIRYSKKTNRDFESSI